MLGVLHTLKVRPARPLDRQALGCNKERVVGGREGGLNSRVRTWPLGETVFCFAYISVFIFNRPGVARAVLQTASSLINSVSK